MLPAHAALRALGLTDYGARAYATLVGVGSATAPEIAAKAGVPRTRVYGVLAELVRKGWAEAQAGRPKRFTAVRPKTCFGRERARLDHLLDGALPALEAQYVDRSTRFAGSLWLLPGRAAVAERTLAMVERARREVFLLASFPLEGDADRLSRALRAAVRRDVRVRLVVPNLDAPHARALAATGAEVRVLALPPRVASVDGREALLALPSPDGDGSLRGIWHSSPEIMEVMVGGMAALWAGAEPAPVTVPVSARRPRRA